MSIPYMDVHIDQTRGQILPLTLHDWYILIDLISYGLNHSVVNQHHLVHQDGVPIHWNNMDILDNKAITQLRIQMSHVEVLCLLGINDYNEDDG